MQTRRFLITGANRGLGLATTIELCRAGHEVLATARSDEKARRLRVDVLEQVPQAKIETMRLELGSMAEIRAFAEKIVQSGRRFDRLHHNAGILVAPEARRMTEDGLEATLAVNALAPLMLSRLLVECLDTPARITATASGLHLPGQRGDEVDFRFEDPHLDTRYSPERAYKNSKLALMWVVHALDRRLSARGIRVDGICPGFVPETAAEHFTGLQRFGLRMLRFAPFATTLQESSQRMARMLVEATSEGGRFFLHWQPAPASADARDSEKTERFYELACQWADLPLD